eukprot:2381467-Rhodomonas_salina.1
MQCGRNKEQALAGLVGESHCEMVFWVEWGEIAEKWEFSVTVSSVVVLSVKFCLYKWPWARGGAILPCVGVWGSRGW